MTKGVLIAAVVIAAGLWLIQPMGETEQALYCLHSGGCDD